MDRLKNIKETLIGAVQGQLGDIKSVNAEELGEVIDMIKDIEEAMYYCTIVEAMKEKDEKEEHYKKYYKEERCPEWYRDMDRRYGRMFYPYYMDDNADIKYYDREMKESHDLYKDPREGRSWESRRNYMEAKEMHHDKTKKLQELEKYMQELTTDIVEMIEDASPEEKQLLQKKISSLATKIE